MKEISVIDLQQSYFNPTKRETENTSHSIYYKQISKANENYLETGEVVDTLS